MSSRDVPEFRKFDPGHAFEQFVRNFPDDAIVLLDCDGVFRTWNAGAARMLGYSPDEIVGQPFSHIFSPEDQQQALPQKVLAIVKDSSRYQAEGWRVHRDGRRMWTLSIIEAIKNDKGQLVGFGQVLRDISESHDGRQALIDSERSFRLLVDSVVDYAIFMIDPSGVITSWNSGARRIKGFTAEEAIGSHFSRFYTKEDRARGLPTTALETARREGKYETEGWRLRKDGGRFWASVVLEAIRDERGDLVGFAKVTRDITERRSAQEALRESERQFRLLVSAVIDYALFMLDPNGVVVSWNAGAQKIKGYRSDEIIGSHFSRFYTEEDRQAGIPSRALHTASREGRFEGEGVRVRKDGSHFWANVVLDAIRDEHGQLVGFAKITRDITERRDSQLALQRAQEQLAHAQKMEALGQLTGGIAHDFNNLLTILVGQARMLKAKVNEPSSIKAIEAIEATVQRGASLTRQLLGFSRRQQLAPQSISLADRLPGLNTLLSASLPSNVSFSTSIPGDTWAITADPNEFELAIMNLVINARDALPAGGCVTLSARNVNFTPDNSVASLSGEFVSITVSDTGVGIPQDVLGKVFDPFFTTKSYGKGTGLGLSQVYGFTHQSGGAVSIESEPGQGTSVHLFLPRSTTVSAIARAQEETQSPRELGRVLVVEDNPDVTEVTAALIMQLGYSVRLATNPEMALDMIAEESFDLVFSDIMMPGKMDGLQFAQVLRRIRPRLPVLLASGSNQRVEEAQAHFTTLQKPYDLAEFDRAIQKLMRMRSEPTGAENLIDLQDAKKLRSAKGERG